MDITGFVIEVYNPFIMGVSPFIGLPDSFLPPGSCAHLADNLPGRFAWFAGPGASISYDSYNDNRYVNIGVGGQIGIEYNFMGIPLMVSLDARPIWDFPGDVNGLGWGTALGIRYTW